MSWTTFGFSGIGGAYIRADSMRTNRTPLTSDRITYIINDAYPFIPGTLRVIINGVNQVPGLDFEEGSNHRTFTWISPIVIPENSNVVVDYIV